MQAGGVWISWSFFHLCHALHSALVQEHDWCLVDQHKLLHITYSQKNCIWFLEESFQLLILWGGKEQFEDNDIYWKEQWDSTEMNRKVVKSRHILFCCIFSFSGPFSCCNIRKPRTQDSYKHRESMPAFLIFFFWSAPTSIHELSALFCWYSFLYTVACQGCVTSIVHQFAE